MTSSREIMTEEELRQAEAWRDIIEIGGETVYVFLQKERVYPFGIFLGLLTTAFQLFTFFIFFREAVKCGVQDSDDCALGAGGFLTANQNGTDITFDVGGGVTLVGVTLGIIITLNFLIPDMIRGFAFLRAGYIGIALVHLLISISAISCTVLYTVTTAATDVEILTNVVVLMFITDLDEKMFTIHKAGEAFIFGKVDTDVVV
eukprot:CAMPEP_0184069346 /NCGR_PEP_ID=MMETSP0957-20130417/41397_1 /TAXON_ID=627963 /ORGANISM="Aplanochytrium sp, Strain PBS07" /LENGTH=202 /DNA_ID=CAMNT_0026368741 /DNA_START=56 /DNA_END=664 /DNA_ORIENTATION=+